MNKEKIVFLALRLSMGFIFLWAFLDKTFGLGLATSSEKAWINGGSPTSGFLSSAVRGPLESIFNSLAGMPAVDWLFMLGLLFVGLTLIFNKFIKLGTLTGGLMLLFMYLALLFPENNPVIDEHIIYILVLALIGLRGK